MVSLSSYIKNDSKRLREPSARSSPSNGTRRPLVKGQGRLRQLSVSRILIYGCESTMAIMIHSADFLLTLGALRSNSLTWYTDPSLHEIVREIDRRAQAKMRSGTMEDAFIAYTNASRGDPIEYRCKDAAAVRRLGNLKQHWYPDGCFTRNCYAISAFSSQVRNVSQISLRSHCERHLSLTYTFVLVIIRS